MTNNVGGGIDRRLYHYNVLKAFNSYLFDTLLYDFHIISDTVQEIQVKEGLAQGFFAKKNRQLYLLDKEVIIPDNQLPIRIKEYTEEVDGKKVFYKVTKFNSFRITPTKTHTFKELVDNLAAFKHSNPEDFKLFKIICLASYCSRTFTRISTNPAFGKDSIKGILNQLTDKVRVIKPRSVPGVLKELTPDGEIVLNESSGMKKEIRDLIQDIVLHLADGSVTYINGALRSQSHHTKDKYDVHMLSITAMYNGLTDYTSNEEFFDYQFANNTAIKDRLLPIRLSGILEEQFDNNFDYQTLMKENLPVLVSLIKNIEYYKTNWQKEQKPFVNPISNLKGRHKHTLLTLFSFINLYSESQEEHNKYCKLLLTRIQDYKNMVEGIVHTEEEVNDTPKMTAVIPFPAVAPGDGQAGIVNTESPITTSNPASPPITKRKKTMIELLKTNTDYYEDQLAMLKIDITKELNDGNLFERKPGVYQRL